VVTTAEGQRQADEERAIRRAGGRETRAACSKAGHEPRCRGESVAACAAAAVTAAAAAVAQATSLPGLLAHEPAS